MKHNNNIWSEDMDCWIQIVCSMHLEENTEFKMKRHDKKWDNFWKYKEKITFLKRIEKRKSKWSGYLLRQNCLIINVIQRKIEWRRTGKTKNYTYCWRLIRGNTKRHMKDNEVETHIQAINLGIRQNTMKDWIHNEVKWNYNCIIWSVLHSKASQYYFVFKINLILIYVKNWCNMLIKF